MGLTILLIILAIAVGAVVLALFLRNLTEQRRRSANWNDLHERGLLIKTQLADLEAIAVSKGPVVPMIVPKIRFIPTKND